MLNCRHCSDRGGEGRHSSEPRGAGKASLASDTYDKDECGLCTPFRALAFSCLNARLGLSARAAAAALRASFPFLSYARMHTASNICMHEYMDYYMHEYSI